MDKCHNSFYRILDGAIASIYNSRYHIHFEIRL